MNEQKTADASLDEAEPRKEVTVKRGVKQAVAGYFTTTRMAYIAIFTAISYALRFWEIPLLPAVSFLKLDFSNIFPLIGGYALGPLAGMTIGILKEALWMFYSSTMCVGEFANILAMLPFVLIPSIAYKRRKGIKSVILFLLLGCAVQVVWSFPLNWLLNFPVFLQFNWPDGMRFFMGVWYWVVLFNVIKDAALAVIVLLVYKPISRIIKLTNAKFAKKSKA